MDQMFCQLEAGRHHLIRVWRRGRQIELVPSSSWQTEHAWFRNMQWVGQGQMENKQDRGGLRTEFGNPCISVRLLGDWLSGEPVQNAPTKKEKQRIYKDQKQKSKYNYAHMPFTHWYYKNRFFLCHVRLYLLSYSTAASLPYWSTAPTREFESNNERGCASISTLIVADSAQSSADEFTRFSAVSMLNLKTTSDINIDLLI